ncbi:unnamed protein product, partial [Prorocentrum cordatum]
SKGCDVQFSLMQVVMDLVLFTRGRLPNATGSPSPHRGVGLAVENGPAGMHTEPLLGASRRQLPVDGNGCCAAWSSFWYRSWATTLTEEYLSSPVSRRRLWKYYGFGVTWCLIGDVVYALARPSVPECTVADWTWYSIVAYYVCEYALAILLALLPVTTLKSDSVVLTYLFLELWLSVEIWQQNHEGNYDIEHFPWLAALVCRVVLCHAAGFHSLFVTFYAACCTLYLCLVSGSSAPEAGCQVGMITIVMSLFEWLLALYFHELREQLGAMQTLLDKATDGYCTVKRQVGTISHVSDSLQLLFGADLRGTQILDAVGPEDRWKVARLCDASQWDVVEPVLATFTQALGEGRQPLEFDARLVPYRATGADVHIGVQRVGEVRMAKRGLAEEVAGPRGPGPSDARPLDRGCSSRESREVDRLVSPLPAFQEDARAQPAAVGEGGRAPMQNGATSSGASQSSTETVDEIHISFDSGHPNFLISDDGCSRHLLPRQGQLVRWFPRVARDRVEKWIINAVNSSVELGVCSEYLEHVELVIPPAPAVKVVAKRAFILVEELEESDTGAISLPATLCLKDVVISRKHYYTTRAKAHYSQDLSAIAEDLHPEFDGSSMNSSEGVSPSDSASVVMSKFHQMALQGTPSSS